MRMLDPKTAIELGETLGQVIPCENPTELVGGDFLHVYVEIDVSKPLCRGRRVADRCKTASAQYHSFIVK